MAGLPDGLRPTSSPTGPGGAGWDNNQNDGDAAVRVCTQETPGLNGGLQGTMIPTWNAVIRNLDGRLVKPATVRPRSVLQVRMFVQMGIIMPFNLQSLMQMWDVKVALVTLRVWEPQAALGMLITQGARIVQAVLALVLVLTLVTMCVSPMSSPKKEGPLEHPPVSV